MSYILEALKKAEQDRALGNVPTLHTAHEKDGAGGPHRSLWAVVGMVAISGVAAVAWYQYRGGGGAETLTSAGARVDAGIETTASLTSAGARVDAGIETTASSTSAAVGVDTGAAASAVEPAPTPVLELHELPPDTLATLPSLAINVVSYSRTKSRRFVMIDQVVYKEGQQISRDLSVEEITPDGAVLTYRGSRFLARP